MSTYQQDLSRWQIEQIGEKLAQDRLPVVDAIQERVTPSASFYGRYIKRPLDILISTGVLLVTLPINLIIAVITYFDVGRPILFKQERIGQNGKPFTIYKFRNMRDERNQFGDPLPPEKRVTKWGKFVRKTSLDELLNFWSILKGDMSLIGPRPLPKVYLERYSKRHMMRLAVKPGLECPPRHIGTKVWTWNEQFENDVWYVENLSFCTDCRMMLNLFRFAFDRKSANARAVAKRGSFMGYGTDGTAINDAEIPTDYIKWAKELGDGHK